MFVHDFVHVERPLPVVVDAFQRLIVPHLGVLVRDAWATDAGSWSHIGVIPRDVVPDGSLPVTISGPRARGDAVVYSVSWPASGGRWFPAFDADLEFAALSPSRASIQVLGQCQFTTGVERWSTEERWANRVTMAAVRRWLIHVAHVIESPASATSLRWVSG